MELVDAVASAVVAVLSADLDLGGPLVGGGLELLGELHCARVVMLVDHHDVVVGLGVGLVGLESALGLAALGGDVERQGHTAAVRVVLGVEVESRGDHRGDLERGRGRVVARDAVAPFDLIGGEDIGHADQQEH